MVSMCLAAVGCASSGPLRDQAAVDDDVRARVGRTLRGAADADTPSLPPDVTLEDGLAPDEAVAVALWNSPTFLATLADLGIARADLVEAGLLRNPMFSLLLPVGPKQLEYSLQLPFEAFWQRPRRVAAARLNLQAVSQRLVWESIALVAQVRTAHAEAVMADARLALAIDNAALVSRLAAITDARWRLGDISELETRAARADAGQAEALRLAAAHDRDLARLTLTNLLGLDLPAAGVTPVGVPVVDPAACGAEPARLTEALASRPDVRAAELAIEAAAGRARWERSRVLLLFGILDGNGRGTSGPEVGPGLGGDLPIFARNQGGISRAEAEVERTSRQYAAVRAQVVLEVRSAFVRVAQAREVLDAWQTDILPSMEREVQQAERAYLDGEIPLLAWLDVSRRLVAGRARRLDAEVALQRAAIALERSVGRSCTTS